MSDKLVEMFYCKKCKMIVFKYWEGVAHYGTSQKVVDEHGDHWEEEFECNDSEVFESYCDECSDPLHWGLQIPFDLFERLHNHVMENNSNGFKVELEDTNNIKPEELKDAIFEALI